jgi:hypothetical protein
MALTKETVVDKIEVLENGTLQVRSAVRVLEDGEVLSQSFSRRVLAPGADTSNEDAKVVAIANATWTTDVVTTYNDMIAAQKAEASIGE